MRQPKSSYQVERRIEVIVIAYCLPSFSNFKNRVGFTASCKIRFSAARPLALFQNSTYLQFLSFWRESGGCLATTLPITLSFLTMNYIPSFRILLWCCLLPIAVLQFSACADDQASSNSESTETPTAGSTPGTRTLSSGNIALDDGSGLPPLVGETNAVELANQMFEAPNW